MYTPLPESCLLLGGRTRRVDAMLHSDQKIDLTLGVILLTEYHASFIRLRRVLLLRSDIRLATSGIRYASFMANKISLKPQGFNITIATAIISLRRSRNIILAFSADLCYNGVAS